MACLLCLDVCRHASLHSSGVEIQPRAWSRQSQVARPSTSVRRLRLLPGRQLRRTIQRKRSVSEVISQGLIPDDRRILDCFFIFRDSAVFHLLLLIDVMQLRIFK